MSDILDVVLELKGVTGDIQTVSATAQLTLDQRYNTPASLLDTDLKGTGTDAWSQALASTTTQLLAFGDALKQSAEQGTRFYSAQGQLLKTSWGNVDTAGAAFAPAGDSVVSELLPEVFFTLNDILDVLHSIEPAINELPDTLKDLLATLDALRVALEVIHIDITGLSANVKDIAPSLKELPGAIKGIEALLKALPEVLAKILAQSREDEKGFWGTLKKWVDRIDTIRKAGGIIKDVYNVGKDAVKAFKEGYNGKEAAEEVKDIAKVKGEEGIEKTVKETNDLAKSGSEEGVANDVKESEQLLKDVKGSQTEIVKTVENSEQLVQNTAATEPEIASTVAPEAPLAGATEGVTSGVVTDGVALTEGVVTEGVVDAAVTSEVVVGAAETAAIAGIGASIAVTGGIAALALVAYGLYKHFHTDEKDIMKLPPGYRLQRMSDDDQPQKQKFTFAPNDLSKFTPLDLQVRPQTAVIDQLANNKMIVVAPPPTPAQPKKQEQKEKKKKAAVTDLNNAIVNGGNRILNINMNAPLYKVDHQVFQKVEDAVKDFEPKLREALLRILYSVPSV